MCVLNLFSFRVSPDVRWVDREDVHLRHNVTFFYTNSKKTLSQKWYSIMTCLAFLFVEFFFLIFIVSIIVIVVRHWSIEWLSLFWISVRFGNERVSSGERSQMNMIKQFSKNSLISRVNRVNRSICILAPSPHHLFIIARIRNIEKRMKKKTESREHNECVEIYIRSSIIKT